MKPKLKIRNFSLSWTYFAYGLVASSLVLLAGCNSLSRMAQVGEEPKMSEISNPMTDPNYKKISMPQPQPMEPVKLGTNSLWRSGSRSFFKDLRAEQVGDIVTVNVVVDDSATLSNTTVRSRDNSEGLGVSAFAGFESKLSKVVPDAVEPGNLVNTVSATSNTGKGTIDRSEKISLRVAAVVTQIMPNGNLVIHGRQETKINNEIRELELTGIIRPQDISTLNTVDYEKIAEGRLAYGGKGHISDVQAPRWGSQLLDTILPF